MWILDWRPESDMSRTGRLGGNLWQQLRHFRRSWREKERIMADSELTSYVSVTCCHSGKVWYRDVVLDHGPLLCLRTKLWFLALALKAKSLSISWFDMLLADSNTQCYCWCLCVLGADGSVRMFDLRHLEHSTIIYEDPQHQPLLRLAWNKQDPNYLATMAMDALEVLSVTWCLFSYHARSLTCNALCRPWEL